MFLPLQTEIDARFAGIKSFFVATQHFRGEASLIAKGLVFVQLYAVYEYTVKSAVQTAIDSINAFGYKMKDIKPSLMALYLDPEFKSLLDASKKKGLERKAQDF
jgi:MAE_28990/MAE_18760-like HEPN